MAHVVVLDYGSGNIRSVHRALERAGASVEVTADSTAAREADGLVIPGVGAFAAVMAGLERVGGTDLVSYRLGRNRSVLGICVGMQILFGAGVEHGVETAGMGVISGRVEPLEAPVVPHMGWNTVAPGDGSILFAGMAPDTRFYFVHSYAVHPPTTPIEGTIFTTTEYGERFVAAVEQGVLSATQFHPEKSGDAGAALLENWVSRL